MERLGSSTLLPLPQAGGCAFRCMASDGCCFYCVLCRGGESWVYRFDKQFQNCGRLRCARGYDSLTYDCTRDCFWAARYQQCLRLFRLDCCFNEIDSITLERTGSGCGYIAGVSADCRNGTLIVAFPDRVEEFNASGNFRCRIACARRDQIFTGVACAGNLRALSSLGSSGQMISITDASGAVLRERELPCGTRVESVVLNSCSGCPLALVTRNRSYSFVLALDPVTQDGNSCGCALCSQAQRRRQSGCDCDDGSETRVPLVETAVRTVAESADAAMCNPCCPEYADLAEQNILGMLDTLTNAQEALDRKLDQLRQWQNTDYGCS